MSKVTVRASASGDLVDGVVARPEKQFGGQVLGLEVVCSVCDTRFEASMGHWHGGPVSAWIGYYYLIRKHFPWLGRIENVIREKNMSIGLIDFIVQSCLAP